MLTWQRTRGLRTHSFSLRAGIAYADAYAGSEVLIATPLLRINYWVLDAAHVKSFPVPPRVYHIAARPLKNLHVFQHLPVKRVVSEMFSENHPYLWDDS